MDRYEKVANAQLARIYDRHTPQGKSRADRLLSAKQVRAVLGVGHCYLNALIKSGHLPPPTNKPLIHEEWMGIDRASWMRQHRRWSASLIYALVAGRIPQYILPLNTLQWAEAQRDIAAGRYVIGPELPPEEIWAGLRPRRSAKNLRRPKQDHALNTTERRRNRQPLKSQRATPPAL